MQQSGIEPQLLLVEGQGAGVQQPLKHNGPDEGALQCSAGGCTLEGYTGKRRVGGWVGGGGA